MAGVRGFMRQLVGADTATQSDRSLLEEFVARRDEQAFAGLLRRHGPLVLGVCRQVLRDPHAAEDAFQATFLVLARKAASVREHQALSAWLYRVALNIARTARAAEARRRSCEREAATMSATHSAGTPPTVDWQPVLHEEVGRLPAKYRTPIVLCYLEGKTGEEAAQDLGWPVGTVKGRLARARELLRRRLGRRGVTLASGGVAALLTQATAHAAIPVALMSSTVQVALQFAAGHAANIAGGSARAVLLAKGALKTMALTKVFILALFIMGVAAIVTAGGVLAHAPRGEEPAAAPITLAKARVPVPAPVLKFTLSATKKEYGPGEAVNLALTIDNPTKDEFSIPLFRLQNIGDLEVTGPDGKQAERVLNPVEISFSNARVTVAPGGTTTLKDALRAINLPKPPGVDHYIRHSYLRMEATGEYRLRLAIGKGSTNELVVKVLGDDFGPEVKGLRARVSLLRDKFTVGDPIEASYLVKNVSKEEQTLWHSGFWPNHQVIVRDLAGKEPPLTDFGRQARRAFSPGGERTKNFPVKVPPGGEDATEGKLDLLRLYDLSNPGLYSVQYIYEEKQGGWEGRLPSNVVRFEVTMKEDRRGMIEKDGGRFEVLVPNRVWEIPENRPRAHTPVTLWFRITNTTKKPLRFSRFGTLFPEMTGPDGKALHLSLASDGTRPRKEADCPLVQPGDSATFQITTMLYWQDGKLLLGGTRFSSDWQFTDALKPGKYSIRIRYHNKEEQFELSTPGVTLRDVWTGEVVTPGVDVTLADPSP
jgi:RNA polymerase sigma factor (sigma-70 family)